MEARRDEHAADDDPREVDDSAGQSRGRRRKAARYEKDSLTDGTLRRFSPLTARILALNILPLATLFAGLMYIGGYEQSLLRSEMQSLQVQARVFAGALGESAVAGGEAQPEQRLQVDVARQMIRRLVAPTSVRARLFSPDGELVVDSRNMSIAQRIRVEELGEGESSWIRRVLVELYDRFFYMWAQTRDRRPLYQEDRDQDATDYEEVVLALGGERNQMIRRAERGYLVLTYAAPVQRYKRVVGALMLSTTSIEIDMAVRRVRLQILAVFAVVLALTVFLSFYLARAIARPINQLAAGAETMRQGENRLRTIPDFSDRDDEIGDLSVALRDLTEELWRRFDAIERFAADVSHEIKNPLSSVRSAVETVARIEDPEKQKQLIAVIQEDIERLDRLITDISRASRLDTELARAELRPVELGQLLTTLAEMHRSTHGEDAPQLVLNLPEDLPLYVQATEDRLVQVFQNLLTNAVSFSPPGGTIRVTARREDGEAVVTVEDEGPGIPPGKEEAIFERFYTERPEGEKFGVHSGLGLSISRQIVTAFGGALGVENVERDGEVAGARFIVRLRRTG